MAACSKGTNNTKCSISSTLEVTQLRERYQMGEKLLERTNLFKTNYRTQGMARIEKQIKAEMTMIEKLLSGSQIIKDHHINSTNLLHLEGVIHICENTPKGGVVAVERFFKYNNNDSNRQMMGEGGTVMVDVVLNEGNDWVKIFARKRQALHKKWLGECNFGDKSVIDFAQDFIKAAQQNPHNFNEPSIIFIFFDGITESVASSLQELDIKVVGPIYPDDSLEEVPSPLQVAAMFGASMSTQPLSLPIDLTSQDKCSLINLDISSMLAWISSITHSESTSSHFNDHVLAEQARQEKENPLWPILQHATKGKSLIVCQTAIDDFRAIVSVVGGPKEKERAKELLAITRIVDDQPSERAMTLHCSGKIKERAKIIFGSGDTLKAITLTANEGFVRAASGRGVHFNVIVHPCRALAELDYKYTAQSKEHITSLYADCGDSNVPPENINDNKESFENHELDTISRDRNDSEYANLKQCSQDSKQ